MLLFSFFFNLVFSDPFGIDPALSNDYRAAINQGNNSFTCLDQSMTIPLSSLNDGKCDCPDGSDEPGTNACLNGHFYCRNIGGKPKLIPSHKVNDGICDCCDGSDEADNPNAQCQNICPNLVEMSSKSRELIFSKIRAGIREKEESLRVTQSEYPQAQRELRELKQDLAKFEHEMDILNRKKREKKKIWKSEKRQLKGISEEEYAELKQRKHDYINKPPKPKETYVEPDPHGFNVPYDEDIGSIDWNVDEGVEELIFHATPRPTPIRRKDVLNNHKGDSDLNQDRVWKRTQKWKEMRHAEKERNTLNTGDTLGFVNRARSKIKELTSTVFGGLASDEPPSYKDYLEVEHEIEQLNSAISDVRVALYRLENRFKHHLGEDNVWWPLSSKSFELSKNGNDYQLNIFEHMLQRQTGSVWFGTGYGTFAGFNATNRTMLYEGGQMCWEGPPRRTEVVLYCGPVNKFLDMEEVDRCNYRAHFETPLCCNEGYLEWVKGMSDLELTDYVSQWMQVEV
ncbi:low-density lipoprotein receptor class A [Tritrichomonas foetus]|uniref:Glucosidase 2 subunit beta n=1 Tax=Tritrichomonas foetus TaxID=1144522 RepID=A0A1J4KYB4_9EUKA|nr:low-density lipoprotein receptor class A [Tritrichomonas foetus]|eukprot:OHT14549.1 low-density lipoprotein receptor class A [Tritrichomonas foetus]